MRSHHFEGVPMNIQELKALLQLGIPYEQAYAQCWGDLVRSENHKKNPMFRDPMKSQKNAKGKAGRIKYDKTLKEARKRRGFL
jgi:hypothetical protein